MHQNQALAEQEGSAQIVRLDGLIGIPSGSYNKTSVDLVFLESVMEPHELLMLAHY
jgi:hypothetical protein